MCTEGDGDWLIKRSQESYVSPSEGARPLLLNVKNCGKQSFPC